VSWMHERAGGFVTSLSIAGPAAGFRASCASEGVFWRKLALNVTSSLPLCTGSHRRACPIFCAKLKGVKICGIRPLKHPGKHPIRKLIERNPPSGRGSYVQCSPSMVHAFFENIDSKMAVVPLRLWLLLATPCLSRAAVWGAGF